MSCDTRRRNYFGHVATRSRELTAVLGGGDEREAQATMEQIFQTARHSGSRITTPSAVGEAANVATRLFTRMEQAGLPPHNHGRADAPLRAGGAAGYAEVERVLEALERGAPLPGVAQAVVTRRDQQRTIAGAHQDARGYYRCRGCGRFASHTRAHLCPLSTSAHVLAKAIGRRLGVPNGAYGVEGAPLQGLVDQARENGTVRMIHGVTGEEVEATLDGLLPALAQGFAPPDWEGRTQLVATAAGRVVPVFEPGELDVLTPHGDALRMMARAFGLEVQPDEHIDQAGPGLAEFFVFVEPETEAGGVETAQDETSGEQAAAILREAVTADPANEPDQPQPEVSRQTSSERSLPTTVVLEGGQLYDEGHWLGSEYRRRDEQGVTVQAGGVQYRVGERYSEQQHWSSARRDGSVPAPQRGVAVGRTLVAAVELLRTATVRETAEGQVQVFGLDNRLLAMYDPAQRAAGDTSAAPGSSAAQMAAILAHSAKHPATALQRAFAGDLAAFHNGQASPLAAADSAYLLMREQFAAGQGFTLGALLRNGAAIHQQPPVEQSADNGESVPPPAREQTDPHQATAPAADLATATGSSSAAEQVVVAESQPIEIAAGTTAADQAAAADQVETDLVDEQYSPPAELVAHLDEVLGHTQQPGGYRFSGGRRSQDDDVVRLYESLDDTTRQWVAAQPNNYDALVARAALDAANPDARVAALNNHQALNSSMPAHNDSLLSELRRNLVDGAEGRQASIGLCPDCGRFYNPARGCIGCPQAVRRENLSPLVGTLAGSMVAARDEPTRQAAAPLLRLLRAAGDARSLERLLNSYSATELQFPPAVLAELTAEALENRALQNTIFNLVGWQTGRGRQLGMLRNYGAGRVLAGLADLPAGRTALIAQLSGAVSERRIAAQLLAGHLDAPDLRGGLWNELLAGSRFSRSEATSLLSRAVRNNADARSEALERLRQPDMNVNLRRRVGELLPSAANDANLRDGLLGIVADESAAGGAREVAATLVGRAARTDDTARTQLLSLSGDGNPVSIRVAALRGLGQAGDQNVAREQLLASLDDANRQVSRSARAAIAEWNRSAPPAGRITGAGIAAVTVPVAAVRGAAGEVSAGLLADHRAAEAEHDQLMQDAARRAAGAGVSYLDRFDAFQSAYTAARERQARGEAAIPFYSGANVTGGLSSRDNGRGFGVELEFSGGDTYAIGRALHAAGLTTSPQQRAYHSGAGDTSNWRFEQDSTVTGEIISPLLYDSPEAWQQIEQVCDIVRQHGGQATVRTGGHIHVGMAGYDHQVERHSRLAELFRRSQDIMYRISTRPGARRHRGQRWCYAIGQLSRFSGRLSDFSGSYNHGAALNFQHVSGGNEGDHVEFRTFDGSLDPAVIQAQVKVALALVDAAGRLDDAQVAEQPDEGMGHHQGRRQQLGLGDRLTRREDWEEDTSSFRRWIDTLFTRDEDKEQVTALFALNRWQS